jgi:D-lactate dehydrogenase (cytochrome)
MDLVDLFIGSEGTLGIIHEAELSLVPSPAAMLSGILFFVREGEALDLVAVARGEAAAVHGVSPAALEFFDAAALTLLRENAVPVPREAGAAIFFEQPADSAEVFDRLLEAWSELAERQRALPDSWLSQDAAEQQRFREFRHLVPTAINEKLARRGVRKVSADAAVPPGRARELLSAYRAILDPAGLECVAFGHVGDDHLHVNIIPTGPDQLEQAKALYGRMVRAAVALGGTVSAEHGLGKLKRQDLALLYPPEVIGRMRAIKGALDPAGILGRGTLFPE